MIINKDSWKIIREPKDYVIDEDRIEITTAPGSDLWQRTYYDFQVDTAPAIQLSIAEDKFIFTAKASFDYKGRFDQCGLIMYVDSDNWLKISIEKEDDKIQYLGSVATNRGYSDWTPRAIPSDITEMWYRVSRNGQDFCIEYSENGRDFSLMRICHMDCAKGEIPFGFYAASPEDASFKAVFTNISLETGDDLALPYVGESPNNPV